jgi:hypothetical protein
MRLANESVFGQQLAAVERALPGEEVNLPKKMKRRADRRDGKGSSG